MERATPARGEKRRRTEAPPRALTSTGHLCPRTFPAVRGNWPCGVVLDLPLDEDMGEVVAALTATLREMVAPALRDFITAVPTEKIHVSVSRTVPLRLPNVAPLTQKLTASLADIRACTAELRGLVLLGNEASSRRFVAVRVHTRCGTLGRIVDSVDDAFAAYQLPPYYEERVMHATLCSYPTTSGLAAGRDTSPTPSGSRDGSIAAAIETDRSGQGTAGGTAGRLTVSDEIDAQDLVTGITSLPVRRLEPGDPDVITPAQVSELEAVFMAACDDLVVDTTMQLSTVRCTAGNKTASIRLAGQR
eukprot:m.158445 g.158445  ORF g.158445 m.158445 type:complete len:304 (+) comp23696_c3_seq1:3498-4409(+)